MNNEEIIENLGYCRSLATFLQQISCQDRTTYGDGRICGCKFITSIENIIKEKQEENFPENKESGCCEARTIVAEIDRIINSLKEKNKPFILEDNLEIILKNFAYEYIKNQMKKTPTTSFIKELKDLLNNFNQF